MSSNVFTAIVANTALPACGRTGRRVYDAGAYKELIARYRENGGWPVVVWQHNPRWPVGYVVWMSEILPGSRRLPAEIYRAGGGAVTAVIAMSDSVYGKAAARACVGKGIGFSACNVWDIRRGGYRGVDGIWHVARVDSLREISMTWRPADRHTGILKEAA